MNSTSAYLILFGGANLLLLIFNKPLSLVVLKFFEIGKIICPPERMEEKAKRLGFAKTFTGPEQISPTRAQARMLLIATGIINLAACLLAYFMLPTC